MKRNVYCTVSVTN